MATAAILTIGNEIVSLAGGTNVFADLDDTLRPIHGVHQPL